MKIEVNRITMPPSAITRVLGCVAVVLVFASLGGQLATPLLENTPANGLPRLLDVDAEGNIPTFFTVLLMLFASLLLALIANINVRRKAPNASKWTVLSLGFMVMGYDEAFQVHEQLTLPVRAMLGGGNLGIFYYGWVIPGIAIVVLVGLFFLQFLRQLPAATRFAFMTAAALYIGGAIGIELIGGHYAELNGTENWPYRLITTVEESLEMAGLVAFIRALLRYCEDTRTEVRFRVEP